FHIYWQPGRCKQPPYAHRGDVGNLQALLVHRRHLGKRCIPLICKQTEQAKISACCRTKSHNTEINLPSANLMHGFGVPPEWDRSEFHVCGPRQCDHCQMKARSETNVAITHSARSLTRGSDEVGHRSKEGVGANNDNEIEPEGLANRFERCAVIARLWRQCQGRSHRGARAVEERMAIRLRVGYKGGAKSASRPGLVQDDDRR